MKTGQAPNPQRPVPATGYAVEALDLGPEVIESYGAECSWDGEALRVKLGRMARAAQGQQANLLIPAHSIDGADWHPPSGGKNAILTVRAVDGPSFKLMFLPWKAQTGRALGDQLVNTTLVAAETARRM